MKSMKSNQQGFTLIELVIVIVVLGILAASALPKFINISEDARRAAIEGMSGSLRSASAMAHSKAIVSKQTGATGSITVEGTAIGLVYGYPTAADVFNLITDTQGYDTSVNTGVATAANGAVTPASCSVTYAEPTAANSPPVITVTTSDCN